VESTDTAGFVISEGCRLAPVINASKKSTATPLGGASPIDRLIGTPLVVGVFMEPPQATSKTQLATASAKQTFRHIRYPPCCKTD
jgi:hypothetical protein